MRSDDSGVEVPENMDDVKRLVFEQIGYVANANKWGLDQTTPSADILGFVRLVELAERLSIGG